MKKFTVVLKEPEFEKYYDGTAEVYDISIVNYEMKEEVVEEDGTQGKDFFDDDDEEYLDDQEEVIVRTAIITTLFLIVSEKTGVFEWIEESRCLLLSSDAGKNLYSKNKIKRQRWLRKKKRNKQTLIAVKIGTPNKLS